MDYRQPKFYRFSEDSLWLAGVCSDDERKNGKQARTIADIGAGCGVVGIEAANRIASARELVLIEPQRGFADSLRFNLSLARPGVNVSVKHTDLRGMEKKRRFDLLVSNPPYFKSGEGRPASDKNRSFCRTFHEENLLSFCEGLAELAAPGGRIFVLAHESNSDLRRLIEGRSALEPEVAASKKHVLLLKFVV